MKRLINLLILILLCNQVLALSDDVNIFFVKTENNGFYVHVPDTPVLESINNNYKIPQMNFFIKSKDSLTNTTNLRSQDFNLNQLVVVGVMNYKNKEYAFIKTPYETLMVKIGDIIKTAKIIKININNVELEEVQMQGNKVYKHKVYLKFDLRKKDNLISKAN